MHGFGSDDWVKVWFNAKKSKMTVSPTVTFNLGGLNTSRPAAPTVTEYVFVGGEPVLVGKAQSEIPDLG
jgi:hypothetical protein